MPAGGLASGPVKVQTKRKITRTIYSPYRAGLFNERKETMTDRGEVTKLIAQYRELRKLRAELPLPVAWAISIDGSNISTGDRMNNDEKAHLAGIILDIFPKRGEENAIRLARAIRTEIVMILSGIEAAEMKQAAPEIPEGWISASEPPDDNREVEIMIDFAQGQKMTGCYNQRWVISTTQNGWIPVHPRFWRELPVAPKPLKVGDTLTLSGKILRVDEDGTCKVDFVPGLDWILTKDVIKYARIDPQEVTK
jgi:hypothetical protein